jgi:flagellar motor switch protein FliG
MSSENCKKNHDNIYEAVFCELKTYAYKKVGEKYDEETHKAILNIVEKMFEHSGIVVDWSIYIEQLLKEMREIKVAHKPTLGGRRFKISRKKSPSYLGRFNGTRRAKKI